MKNRITAPSTRKSKLSILAYDYETVFKILTHEKRKKLFNFLFYFDKELFDYSDRTSGKNLVIGSVFSVKM